MSGFHSGRKMPVSKQRKSFDQKKRELEATYPRITIYMKIPTVNEWDRKGKIHWGYQSEWKKRAYKHIFAAVKIAGLEKIETPCIIQPVVYKRHRAEPDPNNYTTPINKMFVDALTEPKTSKTRGLGLLPDDTADYVTHADPIIHLGAERDKVVLIFKPRGGGHERSTQDDPKRQAGGTA